MPETKQLLRETRDRIAPPPDVLGGLERRRQHKENLKRVAAAVVAIVVALLGFGGWFLLERDTAPTPADRSEELGIFAPVAGRILFEDDRGAWAVDPNGPSDTTDGPRVADDVASTLVPLQLDGEPLGWSSDGTELLVERSDPSKGSNCDIVNCANQYLYILHADGSETKLNEDPMGFAEFAAAIAPDGSRVVYTADGVWVVDADGGRPVHLADEGEAPTFSPDGRQVAYFVGGNDENQVWVANADGSDAHEILADDATLLGAPTGMQWSPAGDRIALGAGASKGAEALAIYTFAPDGSDFTRVINGGQSPYWSPNGTQIAYSILCEEQPTPSCPEGSILRSQYDAHPELFGGGAAGLAIADADGSNVREFGYGTSGPWHPGDPVQPDETTPTPDDSFARANGEVLSGPPAADAPAALVAVDPATGEERVLVEGLGIVYSARWSADGRWVAYETTGPEGEGAEDRELWVMSGSQEPRLVATGGQPDGFAELGLYWMWSPTGADLMIISHSRLSTIDLTTGETTDLGRIVADLISNGGTKPAFSPDGTRLVFAAPEGAPEGLLDTVDVRSGERLLLARLPDQDWDRTDEILWSPDGAHIAVLIRKASNEAGRLYVMDADGSNLRVVADDYDPLGVAWSPDGTQLAFADGSPPDPMARIWVAPMDGAAPSEIEPSLAGCEYNYECGLTWSPDGSRLAFHNSFASSAVDADGRGEAEAIDELTYLSWAGGSYEEA